MKQRVALIFGGEGYEKRISEISAENLCHMIDENLYEILFVGIDEGGSWYIYNGTKDKIKNGEWRYDGRMLTPTYPVKLKDSNGFLTDGELLPVCCAIPCLHGDFGEDGVVQGALQAAHISYVGQDVYASAFTSDKSYTKLAAEHLGIPTAKWVVSTEKKAAAAREIAEKRLDYPMFIKPARLGSSFGAHPVYCAEEFSSAYDDAKSFGQRILIEELLPISYELECAFLDVGERLFSPCGRIFSDGVFYDFDSKYVSKKSPLTEAKCIGDSEIERTVAFYAEKLADFIGLKQLSRIDFFVTRDEKIYFNEINVFPGMTATSLYPKLTETMGFHRSDFINLLIARASVYGRHI